MSTRVYSTRLAALTIGVPFKWIDNLLSHFDLPGVNRGRQGVERRISDDGLLAIELARILSQELGVPLPNAVAIARSSLAERTSDQMRVVAESGVTIEFAAQEIERRLHGRLVDAVEALGRVSRGRPRHSRPT